MKKTIIALLLIGASATSSAAPIYEYAGSWFVDDGPSWSAQDANGDYTTPVFSGIEAASFIFGGNAEDYAISTVSNQIADINFSTWMDGWGDSTTYGYSGNPAAQDLHIDLNGDGLYALDSGFGQAYSAFVSDHSLHLQNFAFRIIGDDSVNVPEPSSIALLGLGLAGFGLSRRKKQQA